MDEMAELLEEVAAGKARPVVLIEGDEYLARSSARELSDAIVPDKDRALNLVILDAAAGAREIASHLLTVAMFPAPKAVLVEGADAFAEEVDAARELSRARDLWQGKRPRDAARRLLKLVRPSGWALAQDVTAPPDDLEVLVKTLERGLPPKTHLILVAESLPPKHALVRLAQEKGAHVKRRAERRGRTIDTLDISPLVSDELGPLKKKLARDAEV